MTPRPGMRYVRPDGSGARVVRFPSGTLRLIVESTGTVDTFDGYTIDWNDGPTLGAVEHDVLGPAGWWVERDGGTFVLRDPKGVARTYRIALWAALRDALEVLDG